MTQAVTISSQICPKPGHTPLSEMDSFSLEELAYVEKQWSHKAGLEGLFKKHILWSQLVNRIFNIFTFLVQLDNFY